MQWLNKLAQCSSASTLAPCLKDNNCATATAFARAIGYSPTAPAPLATPITTNTASNAPSAAPSEVPESVKIVSSLLEKYSQDAALVKELQALQKRLVELEAANAGKSLGTSAKIDFSFECECCKIFGAACDGFPQCTRCKHQGMPCVFRVAKVSAGSKNFPPALHITSDPAASFIQVLWPPGQEQVAKVAPGPAPGPRPAGACCSTCESMNLTCEPEPCKTCKALKLCCVYKEAPKKCPAAAEKESSACVSPAGQTSKLKKSCERCVASKVKCDGYPVCSRCAKKGWKCVFTARRKRSSRPRPISATDLLAEAALASFKKVKCCVPVKEVKAEPKS